MNHFRAVIATPGRSGALQPLSPLRTVHDSFHSYGSGPLKAAILHVATRSPRQSVHLCDTHLKPLNLLLHCLPVRIVRFPAHLPAGRRINCPWDSSHLLSFLSKRFFKLSRSKAPCGRLLLYRPGNVFRTVWNQPVCDTLRIAIRFSHFLIPYFPGPLLRSACRWYSIGERFRVTDDPVLSILTVCFRFALSAGGSSSTLAHR